MKTALSLARKELFYCGERDWVVEIADILQRNNVGSILVRDSSNKVIGVVTVGDILRLITRKKDIQKVPAKEIMSSPVISASKDIDLKELVRLFREKKVTRMLLTDGDGKYVGVVRDVAVYRQMAFERFDEEAKERFGEAYFNPLHIL